MGPIYRASSSVNENGHATVTNATGLSARHLAAGSVRLREVAGPVAVQETTRAPPNSRTPVAQSAIRTVAVATVLRRSLGDRENCCTSSSQSRPPEWSRSGHELQGVDDTRQHPPDVNRVSTTPDR